MLSNSEPATWHFGQLVGVSNKSSDNDMNPDKISIMWEKEKNWQHDHFFNHFSVTYSACCNISTTIGYSAEKYNTSCRWEYVMQ